MFRIVKVCARPVLLAMAATVVLSIPADAQTVVDATTAEFQPSADHNTTSANGTALVTYYLLQFFPGGSSSASHSIDMGKPVPGTDGLIRFQFTSSLATPLVAGTNYQARVSAVGPGGTAASGLSNTFTVSGPCTPSISATSVTVVPAASTGSVSVTASTGCPWTAASSAGWITVTSGASGTGNGSVGYSVAANPAIVARTGTLTIAGRTFTVTQQGVPCTYTVTPATLATPAAGTSSTLTIATLAGCAWAASGMPSWITIPTVSQNGPGSLAYTVAANTGTARSATLTVAGRPVVVNQAAIPVPPPPGNFRVVTDRQQP